MGEWQGKSVLVTGCTGMIGSWLTERLVEEGAGIVGIVRDHVPKSYLFLKGIHKKINLTFGDITDFHLINRVLAEYEVDTVFHLAAQTIVTIANRSPMSTFETNIRGTWTLLEACRLSPTVERVVVASSDKAYGQREDLPYIEEHPLEGRHPYDVSKSCTDLIARSFYHTYGLPVAVSRLANVFGGGDLNFNRIIPGTIQSLLQNRTPVIRSDGTPLREYIYVRDAVEAYLVLARNVHRQEVAGQAFNFGPHRPYSVLEIVEAVVKAAGLSLKPDIRGKSFFNGEIPHQYSDSSKARSRLEWYPQWELPEGLVETIAWYRDFFERMKVVG
ncbi:GDP-mannose 4,6-dehydratase [Desulforamulus ruminis]|nr:GDP-mannose 4,6-dehydratase [Desulforamulus ruminis]